MRERLRVLVCPQELKGSLTAFEAAAAIAAGVRRALPGATVVELPLADGGPGTAAIVSAQGGGDLIEAEVTGPLGALGGTVRAQFALLPPATEGGGPVAVIEAAQAAGLALVPEGERDVGRATTYGVGELVRAALDRGARELIVGSAARPRTTAGRARRRRSATGCATPRAPRCGSRRAASTCSRSPRSTGRTWTGGWPGSRCGWRST